MAGRAHLILEGERPGCATGNRESGRTAGSISPKRVTVTRRRFDHVKRHISAPPELFLPLPSPDPTPFLVHLFAAAAHVSILAIDPLL